MFLTLPLLSNQVQSKTKRKGLDGWRRRVYELHSRVDFDEDRETDHNNNQT